MDAIQMQTEGNHLAKVLPFTYFIKWWNLNACEWCAQSTAGLKTGLQELEGSSNLLPPRSPRAGWPQTRCLLLRLASLLQTAILSLPWIRGGAFGQLAALKPSPNKCWCCGGGGSRNHLGPQRCCFSSPPLNFLFPLQLSAFVNAHRTWLLRTLLQLQIATRPYTGTNCGVKVKCPGTQNCQQEGECPFRDSRKVTKALSVTENHQRPFPATTSTPPLPLCWVFPKQWLKLLLREWSSFAYMKSGPCRGNKKQLASTHSAEFERLSVSVVFAGNLPLVQQCVGQRDRLICKGRWRLNEDAEAADTSHHPPSRERHVPENTEWAYTQQKATGSVCRSTFKENLSQLPAESCGSCCVNTTRWKVWD